VTFYITISQKETAVLETTIDVLHSNIISKNYLLRKYERLLIISQMKAALLDKTIEILTFKYYL